ncbi:Protein DPCD like protein [Aduncisulcus paluster]|uniref:Protein DPCD n=1 Tax=Aduncisulcus paluster TaxID=2918883 RepID=A0ABQ5K521_9EUKA|nr:Protein DPCD like protein [Aduncisulcus paluster]
MGLVPGGNKTVAIRGDKKFIKTVYDNGTEVEEILRQSDGILIVRRVRHQSFIGDYSEWNYEVGSEDSVPELKPRSSKISVPSIGIRAKSYTPICVRHDLADAFEWHISPLIYPSKTYDVSVEGKFIVVKTTNRKYYKKINLSDIAWVGEKSLDESLLKWNYVGNTLKIRYKKSVSIIRREREQMFLMQKAEKEATSDKKTPGAPSQQCPQQ